MSTLDNPAKLTALKALICTTSLFMMSAPWLTPAAHASDNLPSVEMALTTLLGDAAKQWSNPSAATAMPVASTPYTSGLTRVVVKRGDTVDRLLRRHLGNTAFSMSYVRQALVRLNPAAFPSGNVHRLEAGITLLVPTEQTLVALLKNEKPAAFAATQGSSGVSGYGEMSMQQSGQWAREQKNWIRYP
ncbi:MAG: hypothetical protein RL357_981 [Pseudomonadota bacterium]|jgi:Tfp pilus assembly protein FimV